MVDLYRKQLLGASKFVKVFERESPDKEIEMPSFAGRGHFQCDCESIPGLTMHGYYNTLVLTGYNRNTESYELIMDMVINRRDTWWEERHWDDDLKRYVCQNAPSFFKLSSYEEYYFTWHMVEPIRMYVRLLNGRHVNDVIALEDYVDQNEFDVLNYDLKFFVWMSKMNGVYMDPNAWDVYQTRPTVDMVRAYNQSRFEEMVYAYGILEDQGDLGPVLTPLKEDETIEQQENIGSQINPTIPNDSPSVEEPTYDFSTTSTIWNSVNTIESALNSGIFSSDFEPGEYEPQVLESDDPSI